MKKHFCLLIGGFLTAVSLLFMACPTESEDTTTPTYSVNTEVYLRNASGEETPNPDVGTITPTPGSGPQGTQVTVAIASGGTYYLEEVVQDTTSRGTTNPLIVTLLDKDVTVKAYFKALPANTFKVTLQQPGEGGTISVTIDGVEGKEYGPVNSTVTLSHTTADGYIFKEYTNADGNPIENPFTLTGNVTVTGKFEKLAGKTPEELLTAGKNALLSRDLAAAINAYEAAYKTADGKNNPEALVHSTIGKLASIAWSAPVGDFFKNHLGLKYYPNTLDALLNPKSWFEYYANEIDEYHDETHGWVHWRGDGYYYWGESDWNKVSSERRYENSLQPPLNVPGWLTDKDPYKDSLVTIGGKSVAESSAWPIILIANLIDKNTTGLNPALDDVITAIFNNPNYTEAVKRIGELKGKEPVKLDGEIVRNFGLSEFFGSEKVYVGWAELELLLSALELVKGTLHYVNSYNWSYDVGFVRDLPWNDSALDQIETIAGNRNKVLPLRTGFMTARSGNHLADSKAAYVEALTSIIDVYDYYVGEGSNGILPSGYKDTLKEYGGKYKTSVVGAKDAIKNGTTFTVPADLLEGQTLTINFGKFFTSGQLALDKLLETEGSGNTKSPVFYGFTWDNSEKPTPEKISSRDDFEKNYEGFGFKLTTAPIKEIVGEAFATELSAFEYLPVLDPMSAQIAWEVYHWDEDSKDMFGGSE